MDFFLYVARKCGFRGGTKRLSCRDAPGTAVPGESVCRDTVLQALKDQPMGRDMSDENEDVRE